jgi:cell wall-associated NlpC family hydrolase
MKRRVLAATAVAAFSLPATGFVNSALAAPASGGATPNSGSSPTGGAGLGVKVASAHHRKAAPARVGNARIVNGLAVAPSNAPTVIKEVIAAGNRIAFKPYIYGGGHGSWNDSGYDCSGSVSYALHGANLISAPEDSTELESYGSPGAGRYITIWATGGHVYMYVLGLRFDTSAQGDTGGSRWTTQARDNSGFVERHPTGL